MILKLYEQLLHTAESYDVLEVENASVRNIRQAKKVAGKLFKNFHFGNSGINYRTVKEINKSAINLYRDYPYLRDEVHFVGSALHKGEYYAEIQRKHFTDNFDEAVKVVKGTRDSDYFKWLKDNTIFRLPLYLHGCWIDDFSHKPTTIQNAIDFLTWQRNTDLPTGVIGQANTSKKSIIFNHKYFTKNKNSNPNKEHLFLSMTDEEKLDKDNTEPLEIKGLSVMETTITHEMGHHLDNIAMYSNAINGVSWIEEKLIFFKEWGNEKIRLKISPYASVNPNEFIAEAFTLHRHGSPKEKETVKQIIDTLHKYLKERT